MCIVLANAAKKTTPKSEYELNYIRVSAERNRTVCFVFVLIQWSPPLTMSTCTYPTAPTEAPTEAPIAPTELIRFVGKKLDSSGRGDSGPAPPPLPAEWGPPEPPLSSDGVLLRKRPVPRSTRFIGELDACATSNGIG